MLYENEFIDIAIRVDELGVNGANSANECKKE
jgi:hypothetical protein